MASEPNHDKAARMEIEELAELHSKKSIRRVEQISALRAQGIGDHIDLPQLVVCGNQSAGKSSVLEGITGLPFPRQDGVCTKFATEIVLQHSEGDWSIRATILPASSRSECTKAELRKFDRKLNSFNDLPGIIAEAGSLMKIRGFPGVDSGPGFAQDVLSICVSGPTGLHLSVVDLPGLISAPDEEQTDDDVEIVHNLVEIYIQRSRSIILAVIHASDDVANQPVLRKARKHDKSGERTVGIITKPDLINEGAEARIALLAKNKDTTKLKLGFFLVLNPTPVEIAAGLTAAARRTKEARFFQSPRWKNQNLDKDRLGIVALKSYLQTLLDEHMERELPKVREEIKKLLEQTKHDISALGDERPTPELQRKYLSHLAVAFRDLTYSALNGTYENGNDGFFDAKQSSEQSQLRAKVQQWNTEFSNLMLDLGEKRKLVLKIEDKNLPTTKLDENPQLHVTEDQMRSWVHEVYIGTRGKELPGTFNHVLLSRLFRAQSSRWPNLAKDYLEKISDAILQFVYNGLSHVAKDEAVQLELADIASTAFAKLKVSATAELQSLIEDEKLHPITYDHSYVNNVEKSRCEGLQQLLKHVMKNATGEDEDWQLHVNSIPHDADKLLSTMQKHVTVNMDHRACFEALEALRAYYDVARKRFVDNVCRQVIERHLLTTLPDVFGPETVAEMSTAELERIAAETDHVVRKRKELRELEAQLEGSLQCLRR